MSIKDLTDTMVLATQNRVLQSLGSASGIDYRFATIVSVAGKSVTVVYAGETMPRPGVRLPRGVDIASGLLVRVAVHPNGDSFVTEVY